ncbi:hypothetical protein B5S33_g3726 [[Candida] boidinii]|nr:hypothetical protein B5S33_g3726 [[Candida] boidinii]
MEGQYNNTNNQPGSNSINGILKGFDQLMNLVLDEVKETLRGKFKLFICYYFVNFNCSCKILTPYFFLQFCKLYTDPEDDSVLTKETRNLGLVVVRGPLLLTISPADGAEVIENPFVQESDETPAPVI